MDILKEIESQIDAVKKIDSSAYLDAILAHVSRAEFYYKSGMADSSFFNDVIYRSNQAYEGALKESYKVLANKSSDEVARKTPNDIENFFATNSIFKERVLQLFKNYRQEWRNKSTHDYQLFFDENEAFIALTSVTSFVHLLLKQIQERVSYNAQQKKLELDNDKSIQIESKDIVSGYETLVFIIKKFAEDLVITSEPDTISAFTEVMGLLHAYLEFASSTLKIQREPDVKIGGRYYSPDFVIESGNERFIVEVKIQGIRARGDNMKATIDKVLSFLQMLGMTKGVLYYASFDLGKEIKIDKITRNINGIEHEVTVISK